MLIVTADDIGRTREATDNSLHCYRLGLITSSSAMVFMSDSERAAESALSAGLESGLHLNLDLPFDTQSLPPRLRHHHQQVVRYLGKWKWTQIIYNPSLRESFRYVFQAQYDEYRRLFGEEPLKIDGHHHMHLSMNMIADRVIPPGIRVRRNFTFGRGEKDLINRFYRKLLDHWLARRYICTDAFFSIEPLQDRSRLKKNIALANSRHVEIMTHPGVQEQYEFLLGPEYRTLIQDIPMGTHRMLSPIPRQEHSLDATTGRR